MVKITTKALKDMRRTLFLYQVELSSVQGDITREKANIALLTTDRTSKGKSELINAKIRLQKLIGFYNQLVGGQNQVITELDKILTSYFDEDNRKIFFDYFILEKKCEEIAQTRGYAYETVRKKITKLRKTIIGDEIDEETKKRTEKRKSR